MKERNNPKTTLPHGRSRTPAPTNPHRNRGSDQIRYLTVTGLIAGLYTALTLVLAPVSFGPVQCRVSEVMTVLAAYTPAAVPGLIVGCVLSNVVGLSMGANVAGALDILLGPLATGVAAWLSYRLRRHRVGGLPLWSTLPPVITNALIVGTELAAVVTPTLTWSGWFLWVGSVAAGQIVACVGGGLLLAKMLEKTGFDRRLEQNNYTFR